MVDHCHGRDFGVPTRFRVESQNQPHCSGSHSQVHITHETPTPPKVLVKSYISYIEEFEEFQTENISREEVYNVLFQVN